MPNFLIIVLELTKEGEMFEKISEKTKLSEALAKLYFLQIALAIKYLFFKKICHIDSFPIFHMFPTFFLLLHFLHFLFLSWPFP